MKNSRLDKFLRDPLLHFLLFGAAIFFVYDMQNENVVDNNRIVISDAQIDLLITVWEKQRRRLPTQVELQAMIEQTIREEVMYREALTMGMDQNDAIVRRRLAQKMEFISSDIAAAIEPTEDDLVDYLNAHPEKFEVPAFLSFEQVYFSRDKRGAQAESDALQSLAKLNDNETSLPETGEFGDSIMLGLDHHDVTEYDVSRLFGTDFSAELFSLEGRDWQGPVVSSYGLHLVHILSKTNTQSVDLDLVRDKVRDEWSSEQRRTMNEMFYESLRKRYDIIVENSSEEIGLSNGRQ